jgi:glycosyltransferase involved in cell wall biosynthesis
MAKISVILATFNEEKNIRDCLESVKWADEIVLVDGSSTDKTVSIARKYTQNITVKDNPVMFHLNKQLAIEKAKGDWILYLDADERVTSELKQELQQAVTEEKYQGYWLPRKNIIFGKWIEHTGWYPDFKLRFFRNGLAYLPCKNVHEEPVLKGEAGYLKNPLLHYNYTDVSQFVDRLNHSYTENDRNVFIAKGKSIRWSDMLHAPVDEFLKRFYLQEGYQDGTHGLAISLLQSFSALVTFIKIWEADGFQELTSENTQSKIEKELKKIHREFDYWILTSKINQAKDPLTKLLYRIKRKIH